MSSKIMLAATLSLAACASNPTPAATTGTTAATAMGHRPGGPREHGPLPPTVAAYHEVLRPLWHSDPGDARNARVCEQGPTLVERAGAIAAATAPAEAGPGWAPAVTELSTTTAALQATCAAAPRGDVARGLEAAHTAFHHVMESLHH